MTTPTDGGLSPLDNNNNNDNKTNGEVNNRPPRRKKWSSLTEEEKNSRRNRKRISKQLEKRLHPKMRPSQHELEVRNIAPINAFSDEWGSMEEQTKERLIMTLQLRNALQARPTPDDLANSNPEEVANDLLRFMLVYKQLVDENYDDEKKTPSPPPPPSITNDNNNNNNNNNNTNTNIDTLHQTHRTKHRSKFLKMRSRSIDRLEWKIAQRSTVNEMAARSIIPAEYIATINTDKEYSVAEQEKQTHFLSAEEKLKRKMELKTRPTPNELFQRGVLVEPSLSDPDVADRVKTKRRKIRQKFAKKYRTRMGKEEAIQRNIVQKEEFEKDHKEVEKIRKEERSALKKKLMQRVSERPNPKEITQRAIVDEMEFDTDHEEVLKSKKLHRRAVTAQLGEKIQQRPKPEQMNGLGYVQENASDDEFEETPTSDRHNNGKESNNIEISGRRGSANESSSHNNKYLSDAEAKRQKHKQLKTLDTFLQRRIPPSEMEARNIVPQGYWQDPNEAIKKQRASLRIQQDQLRIKFQQRPSQNEVVARGLIQPMSSNSTVPREVMQYQRTEEMKSGSNTLSRPIGQNKVESQRQGLPAPDPTENEDAPVSGNTAGPSSSSASRSHRRMSTASELAVFFQSRPEVASLFAKGIMKSGILQVDPAYVQEHFQEQRRALQDTLSKKLDKNKRPSQLDLEMRGIVPLGYFRDSKRAIHRQHERRKTTERELHSFLQQRSSPNSDVNFVVRPSETFISPPGPEEDLDSAPLLPEYTTMPAPFPMAPSLRQQLQQLQQTQQLPQQQQQQRQQQKASNKPNPNNNNEEEKGEPPIAYAQFTEEMESIPVGRQSSVDSLRPPSTEPKRRASATKNSKRRAKKQGMGKSNMELFKPMNNINGGAEVFGENVFSEVSLSGESYAAMMDRLRWEKVGMELQKRLNSGQNQIVEQKDKLSELLKEHEILKRDFLSTMANLQHEKKALGTKLEESEKTEKSAMEILQQITLDHASLENRIRSQMKQLLYQQTRLEYRINSELAQLSTQQINGLMNDLSYYQKYIKELHQTLQSMNTVRNKYENSLRECVQNTMAIQKAIQRNQESIERLQQETKDRMARLTTHLRQLLPEAEHPSSESEKVLVAKSGDSLMKVLNAEDEKLTHDFGLLAFRLSTIPVPDYVNRLMEICQLSSIYQQDKLKKFFEYFVRIASQAFIEISYAYSCFVNNNEKAITEQLPRIEMIKYIAELTPGDLKNNESYEISLQKELAIFQEYLDLLPDRELVICEVARHLTTDAVRSAEINTAQDSHIPILAKQRVKEWIAAIIGTRHEDSKGEKHRIRSRPLLECIKSDAMARVDSSQAASIILSHAFGVYTM